MNRSVSGFSLLSLAVMALAACSAPAAPETTAAKPAGPSETELLARGEYLVRIAGCNDCHTPPTPSVAAKYRSRNGWSARHWASAAPGAPPMPPTCA